MKRLIGTLNRWAYINWNNDARFYLENKFEIFEKNLQMVNRLSLFFFMLFFFTFVFSVASEQRPQLQLVLAVLMGFEAMSYIVSFRWIKENAIPKRMNVYLLLYLFSLIAAGIYISGIQYTEIPGTIILPVFVLIQVLFIFPPFYTTILGFLASGLFVAVSYAFKSPEIAHTDFLNTLCTLLLSLIVGWHVGRERVQEASCRNRAEMLNSMLQNTANTDFLTGLSNRRKFQKTYHALFQECKKNGDCIGVIMIDIDSFKLYNDHYGHLQGDACLRQLGQYFCEFCRDGIGIYRYGGEEFVVLLSKEYALRAEEMAKQLCKDIEDMKIVHQYSRTDIYVTISAGVYCNCINETDTEEGYLERADKAMYKSKYLGGNRVVSFFDEIDDIYEH